MNGNAMNGNTINGSYTNGSTTTTYGSGNPLQHADTAGTLGSINLPRDVFEQLYLSPQNAVKGDLRKTFGNPTPL